MAPKKQKQKQEQKQSAKAKGVRRFFRRIPKWIYAIAFGTAVGAGFVADEEQNSRQQSRIFNEVAQDNSYRVTTDLNADLIAAPLGPYDERFGYTKRLEITENLVKNGYQRSSYATGQVAQFRDYVSLFPIYPEKAQTGLTLTDTNDDLLHQVKLPKQAYQDISDIPQLLIDSLCFVENKELCEKANPQKNPAVEWIRFSNAVFGQLKEKVGLSNDGSGGSTLATQLEKVRHSKGGITRTHEDKLQQMVTATAKAYQDGLDTTEQRERIIRDYINEMPLAAFKSYGQVIGFADGVTVWFGADFNEVNALLNKPQEGLTDEELRPIARAYRQALTLIMAVKQPSEYLLKNRSAMQDRIEGYLPKLAESGVISQRLMRLAQAEKLDFSQTVDQDNLTNDTPKSTDTVRIALMEELGYSDLIQTELWDMSAKSTIDSDVTQGVEDILQQFKDPTSEIAQNIIGFRMAKSDTAHQIDYAVTLYQSTNDANILRVQADTSKGHFNFNSKSKLELGSTAKLRTLVTYLEVIEELHQTYLDMSDEERANKVFNEDDHLSIWVNEYMSQPDVDKTKAGILAASMQRSYSGNTSERFFTGGAYHRFHNFKGSDHRKELTVEEAIRRSVNLPLIRMMRDIVNYTLYNQMEIAPDIYTNKDAPQRVDYLEQYADKESKIYLWRFWKELRNKTPDEIAETLALKTHKSPVHLTVVYRTIFPEASYTETAAFIKKHCGNCKQDGDYADTFEKYGPGKFNINDQAYITSLNEIELWLGHHLTKNPDARWADLEEPSADVRKEGYKWLMKSSSTRRQNKRIRITIEQEAFDEHIFHRWKKQGFPFDQMVASYASSIGVSGDKPSSLADLAGILMNEGQRKTISTFEEISFAKDTPYEENFEDFYEPSEQVISPEVAKLAHHAMQTVVANGTAIRAKKSIKLSNGRHAIIGGKTGTGDNRKQIRYKDGSKESIAVNRTATFMFTIDQCMYGTIMAFAPGEMADAQKFTSSLPVQAFKELIPTLLPLFDKACTADYNPTPIPPSTEYTINVKLDITPPTLPTPPAPLPKGVL